MKEFIGENSLDQLPDILKELNSQKIILITNRKSFFDPEIEPRITKGLHGFDSIHFNNISPNPTDIELIEALISLKESNCDTIIGVGGGSAMDMAKMCAIYWDDTKIDLAKTNHTRSKKLILIPTTAGSGSEATQFAVVYENGNKVSIDHPALLPDAIFLDPHMTVSLPNYITAFTAADAFCQAVESYWAALRTPESMHLALKAIDLVWNNALDCVLDPKNLTARLQVLEGSKFSGAAINITRTTAPHALSYFITQKYSTPHGHAVALSLPWVLEENARACDLSEIFNILDVSSATSAREKILDFFTKLGLKTKLSDLGIENLDEIADAVNLERIKNNPVHFTMDELKAILQKMY